jgi:uncharacterized protein YlxW (UPF0749 family)
MLGKVKTFGLLFWGACIRFYQSIVAFFKKYWKVIASSILFLLTFMFLKKRKADPEVLEATIQNAERQVDDSIKSTRALESEKKKTTKVIKKVEKKKAELDSAKAKVKSTVKKEASKMSTADKLKYLKKKAGSTDI